MSTLIDFAHNSEFSFDRRFRAYVGEVARTVGVGLESCTVDLDVPASAYIALDWRMAGFPGQDIALMWDEVHGWAVATEDTSGEGSTVLIYLGGREVIPEPRAVLRFLARVRAADPSAGALAAPVFRQPGRHEDLLEHLASARQ